MLSGPAGFRGLTLCGVLQRLCCSHTRVEVGSRRSESLFVPGLEGSITCYQMRIHLSVAPSPSSPRRRRLSVQHREVLIRWHLTAPARKAGRGLGTRSAAATLDACRALLADHLSYGDRWGNPPAGA
ncbi:unnamed protein product [Pleuronectes platessa]|uniref:Uncharacterized protein n=1 Tax=Pleuronectes platessa TaxID=8262 RepID=A0A9N7TKB4_PLEPL|nr:unnamed protein product [Pleuronectes platessa]